MTTKALFQKEFRECWKIGAWAAGVMLAFCLFLLRSNAVDLAEWKYMDGWESMTTRTYGIKGSLSEFDAALLFPIIIMGVALAIRQFLVPFYTGEWGFLLHRPVPRGRVLAAKLGVATLLLMPLVLIWLACWLVVQIPGWYPSPTSVRILFHGLIMLTWGAVVYCAVADGVLLHHHKPWHGIRWAAIIMTAALSGQCMNSVASELAGFQWLAIALFSASFCGTFLNREF
jgi:ABC-type transport system involved in multi-copper enzyme maturation permease subunit